MTSGHRETRPTGTINIEDPSVLCCLLSIHWIMSYHDVSKEFNASIFRLNSPITLPFRLLDREYEDTINLRNVGVCLIVDTAQHKKNTNFMYHVATIYHYAHSWNIS